MIDIIDENYLTKNEFDQKDSTLYKN